MVTKTAQFAVHASIPPGCVLGCEAEDEPLDLKCGGWSSQASVGLCPVSGDASSVPPQECVGGDQPAGASWAGERGCDRPEQGPVIIVDCGPLDLSA